MIRTDKDDLWLVGSILAADDSAYVMMYYLTDIQEQRSLYSISGQNEEIKIFSQMVFEGNISDTNELLVVTSAEGIILEVPVLYQEYSELSVVFDSKERGCSIVQTD